VLLYPGTDVLFPSDSYGVDGPFASLRLKHWRRGVQDVDYLTLASAVNPNEVRTLVNTMVPKAGWEYGVTDPGDPSYVIADISWSNDPQVWESARARLADIISGAPQPPDPDPTDTPPTEVPPAGDPTISPNPWRVNQHRGLPLTFENFAPNSTISIVRISGRPVKTLTAPDGDAAWDLTDGSGRKVASGIYIYTIKAPDNRTIQGKLAIIK
jgi:hypothetical protein